MKRLFKFVLGLLGAVVLLLIVAAIALPMMFDTDDLKARLVTAVKEQTGRDLVIAGDLEFSVFPWLAVEVNELSLGNAPGFGAEPMARVGLARAGVGLVPLLRRELVMDQILIDGLELDLAVNKRGTGNWEGLSGGDDPVPTAPPAEGSSFTFSGIAGVTLRDADIGYRDAGAGTEHRVDGLDLETGRLGGDAPVPVKLSARLQGTDLVIESPAMVATAEGLSFSALTIEVGELELAGSFSVQAFTSPEIAFDLATPRLDLDRLLGAEESDGEAAMADAQVPGKELRGLSVNGTLRAEELRFMDLELTGAIIGVTVADGRARLHPLTADVYGGRYSGDVMLDGSRATPRLSLDEQVDSVVFAQLAGDLLGEEQLSGTAFGNAKLRGRGKTSSALLSSLAGQLDLRLDEGALEGINVWHEVRKAYALLKGLPAPEPAEQRTPFSRMALGGAVQDGVLNVRTLNGDLPFLELTGAGRINIASLGLNLDLVASVRDTPELARDPLAADLKGKRLPLKIGGTLDQPSVGVDFKELLKSEAAGKLLEKLGVDPGEEGEAPSTEDAAAQLIRGLLGGDRDEEAEDEEQPDG